ENFIVQIQQINEALQQQAVKAVNISLTLRNWLIGFYIVEFEQNGDERAKYGERLLETIDKTVKIRGLGITNLKWCRIFYQTYPQIIQATSYISNNPAFFSIRQLLTDELQNAIDQLNTIRQLPTDEFDEPQKHINLLLNN